jgi:two-component system, NtrC family, nitrogen regulation response regulator GlnG
MSGSRRPRVLIVDDQLQVRDMLVEYFAEAEFEVTTASDVPTAMAVLATGADVVISDIRMPGQSGIDFLQQAKAQYPALGVFLVTGYPEFNTRLDARTFGAQAYIQKPLDLGALERRIREFLATVDTGAHPVERSEDPPATAT